MLDDYSPLRYLSEEVLAQEEFLLFPVRTALAYEPADHLGGLKGSQGDSFFNAENPPFGAIFTCYLRDSLKTKKDARKQSEKKVKEAGGDNPYPGWDVIKEEDREEAPAIVLEIRDSAGEVIDRIDGPTSAGIHRIAWNLRYAPFTGGERGGAMVVPGQYSVQALRRAEDVTTPLGEPRAFEVRSIGEPSLPAMDPREILAFQMEVGELDRSLRGAEQVIAAVLEQLEEIKALIRGGRVPDINLMDEARATELRLIDARERLSGDPTRESRGATGAPSISSRLRRAYYGTLGNTHGPTLTHRQQYEIARSEYGAALAEIREVVEVDLESLQRELDEAGAPWTAGRAIPTVPGLEAEAVEAGAKEDDDSQ